MSVLRIALTEDERRVVNAERDSHPEAHVRRKMLVMWLLHYGLTRSKAAEIVGLSRPTVQRYVVAYCTGGLDGLRRWGIRGPVSDLVAHTSAIREALTNRPVRTAAEVAEQIECLSGPPDSCICFARGSDWRPPLQERPLPQRMRVRPANRVVASSGQSRLER